MDMTAMVDVAFLLLTFFILSTQLPTQEGALSTAKPVPGSEVDIACEKNLTLFLGDDDQIYWYGGCDQEEVQAVGYGPAGIRKLLVEQRQHRRDMIITIKPGELSNFQNLVSIIDEIEIVGAPKYALAEMSPEEKEFLATRGIQ
jgi:biopolymer transport protein ExbD